MKIKLDLNLDEVALLTYALGFTSGKEPQKKFLIQNLAVKVWAAVQAAKKKAS